MEVRSRQRSRTGQLRLLQVGRVVVATQCELPLRAWLGSPAGRGEPGPRDTALDRPPAVLVIVFVQRAATFHGGFQAEFGDRPEPLVPAGTPRGKVQLQRRVGGV